MVWGLGIVRVENRVIGFTEPHASEDMLRVMAVLGVLNILAFDRENSEAVELGVVAHEALVALGCPTGHGEVVRIFIISPAAAAGKIAITAFL